MDFTTEMKSFLNDTNQPLEKRLKIAYNALNSNELPGYTKEEILLDWFSKLAPKSYTSEVWVPLYSCLSASLQNSRYNDIKQSTLLNLVKAISKTLKKDLDDEVKMTVTNCVLIVLKNDCFKQYFKYNMETYCKFIATVLQNTTGVSDLQLIMRDQNILNQKLFVKTESCVFFVTHLMPTFFYVISRQKNNTEFVQLTINIIQKCIFQNNTKLIEAYVNKSFDADETYSDVLPNLLLKKLLEIYNDTSENTIAFKIIVNAFFQNYKSQTQLIFKFTILLLQLIGFDYSNMFQFTIIDFHLKYDNSKSLSIMSEIFEIIHVNGIGLDTKINETSFHDFIKHNLMLILNNKPILNESIIKILKSTMLLNPIIIENSIANIIYCMTSKLDENTNACYTDFLLRLFEMYFKLHRIHKFTSEILRILKDIFVTKDKENDGSILVDKLAELLPVRVLKYYEQCIILQTGKQIISIMRTLLTHLEDIVNNITDYSRNSRKTLYLQLLTELICCFLSAVKIADYSTTQNTLAKFCKDMDELKYILCKFGTSLLQMEHNHELVYCFLKVSESWGEVIITLKYYCIRLNSECIEDLVKPISDVTDFKSYKMTQFHNYLSTEHWSLMSQRIKNFGERPCQEIMLKLVFQKLRAFVVLNPKDLINTNETSIIKKSLIDIDSDWFLFYNEKFSIQFFSNADISFLLNAADYILKEFIKNDDERILDQYMIKNNRSLALALIFTTLKKINSLFKSKRKHNEDTPAIGIATQVFKCFESNVFIKNGYYNDILNNISIIFNNYQDSELKIQIDESKFLKLLTVLTHIPLCDLPNNCQSIIFLYLLALCIDLRKILTTPQMNLQICETLLNGIMESPFSPNIAATISIDILIKYILEHVTNYRKLIIFILNKSCRYENTVKSTKKLVEYLSSNLNNDTHIEISSILLTSFINVNKYKLSPEIKDHIKKYKEDLHKELFGIILNHKKVNKIRLESYVLVLQYVLQKEWNDDNEKLLFLYDKYVEFSMRKITNIDCVVCLHLFEILLRNKARISYSEELLMTSWAACSTVQIVDESGIKQLTKTSALIFEYITLDKFTINLKTLLDNTVKTVEEDKLEEFEKCLKLWFCLLNSALSTVKQEILLNSLLKLFQFIISFLLNINNDCIKKSFVNLQLNLIENKKILLSNAMIDIHLQTVSVLMIHSEDVINTFKTSISILDSLLQKRKFLIVDRLPSFLIYLRIVLNELCKEALQENYIDNSNTKSILNCVYLFEKLIRSLSYLKKDVARLVPYLISDILLNYEKHSLFQGAKTYLDNSLCLLIELCDSHAISYLFRVLSPASTELFKIMYNNFNKYHKFAGRI